MAGTGSECNGGAVITNEEQERSRPGGTTPGLQPPLCPDGPQLHHDSVPKRQTVSGGFDILSHIMETYFSAPDEENVSDDIIGGADAGRRSVTCGPPCGTRRTTPPGAT